MSYAALGVTVPGLNIDSSQIVSAIIQNVGPPVTSYIKSQIPAITDAFKAQLPSLMREIEPIVQSEMRKLTPLLQAEANNLAASILNGPDVARLKRQAMMGALVFGLAIVGGTWAAVKYVR